MKEIKIFDNSTDLDRAVAETFLQNALKAQSEGRNLSVALCGGKTPYGVYARLTKPECREKIIRLSAYIPNRENYNGGSIPKQQGCLKSRMLLKLF